MSLTPKKEPPAAAAKKAPAPAAAAPKAEQPKELPTPPAAVEEPVAAAAPEPSLTESSGEIAAPKKKRVQLAAVLGVSISQARCATHLKTNLGDEEVEAQIKGLRAEMKAAKAEGNEGRAAELKAQVETLSKTIVRISGETPIAVAVVMDELVKELIRHAMNMAIAGDRRMVEMVHVHDGEVGELLYFPIFSNTPTFKNYNPEQEEEIRLQKAAENKAAKEAREAKKAAGEGKKAAKPAKPEDEDDGEEGHTKTTFFTYVENALKAVKQDEQYSKMRVGNRVRECLSQIVAEAILRLATLSRIVVQQVADVRTLNADHVEAVVSLLMADAGRTPEQFATVKACIAEKLAAYRLHVATEKEKKAAEIPATKKAELEHKKLESELARKRKQADYAKKRAQDALARANVLDAETAKLEPLVSASAPLVAAN